MPEQVGTNGTKTQSETPCHTYDFRISKKDISKEDIIKCLKEYCKKWVFQEEKGEKTGYEHYQGRCSLKEKRRKKDALKAFQKLGFNPNYLEKTSKTNQTNNFYVTKEDTRINGPWSDEDVVRFIPRHLNVTLDKLRPFQQKIFESGRVYNDRNINVIFDDKGCLGKSFVGLYCQIHGKGFYIAPLNDPKEIIQMVCDKCMSTENHAPTPIIIDLPRSMNKSDLSGVWNACEQIKNCYLYDIRYHFKEWYIESPQIWVFTNTMPDIKALSKDRWNFWLINKDFDLEPLKIETKKVTIDSEYID